LKRLINFLIKLAGTVTGLTLALVALRRILLDLHDIIETVRSAFSGDTQVPPHYRKNQEQALRAMIVPATVGSLPIGRRLDCNPWIPESQKSLTISSDARQRDPNILLIGSTGCGKTRHLANLVMADIESGNRAVIVIDSDGALVDLVDDWISRNKRQAELSTRVLHLNPSDPANSLTYKPINCDWSRSLSISTALVRVMETISKEPPGSQSVWNQQSANIFRNSVMLLIANNKTLADLPTLVTDNDFRDILLEALEKKKEDFPECMTLLTTWNQYKRLARTDQWITWVEPILNRLSPALTDPRIRSIITASTNSLNLQDVIARKQILLVHANEDEFDSSAILLGALIVAGVKEATAHESRGKQKQTSLYLDTLDKFVGPQLFELILSDTSSPSVEIIGAMRSLQKLPEYFRHELLKRMGTLICFTVGREDAELLAPRIFRFDTFRRSVSSQVSEQKSHDASAIDRLMHQPFRQFYCYKLGTASGVFRLRSQDFPF
jgi:Type IV secretion-system coupling protein DNA-binding domain